MTVLTRVTQLVDDVAATFQICRADLNVVRPWRACFASRLQNPHLTFTLQRASSKGLMCGTSFTVHLKSGDAVVVTDGEVCWFHRTSF